MESTKTIETKIPKPEDPFKKMPDLANRKKFEPWLREYFDRNYQGRLAGMEDSSISKAGQEIRERAEKNTLISTILEAGMYVTDPKNHEQREKVVNLIREFTGEIPAQQPQEVKV